MLGALNGDLTANAVPANMADIKLEKEEGWYPSRFSALKERTSAAINQEKACEASS